MRRLRTLAIHDERGTTLAELVVALAAGMVVILGVTSLVTSSLDTSVKVSKHVEATQQSRIVLTRLIDELNSACIMPKLAPVKESSSSSMLRFIHARGSEVTPAPTLSVVSLEGTKLVQADYAWKEGTAPNWVFQSTPSATTQLMTGVEQISSTTPIFGYYSYSEGGVSKTRLTTPLSATSAADTIQVSIALKVAPRGGSSEESAPSHIQDSATFRLTAASYHPETVSLPCQ